MKKISEGHWAAVKEQRARRDNAAYCIGVASVEYRRAEEKFLSLIQVSEQDEQRIAEMALGEAGYDVRLGEYRIGQDGIIGQLVNGVWVHPDTNEPIKVDEEGTRLA